MAKQRQKPVKLSKEQRTQIINELTTNCDCSPFQSNDVELLNNADDERLVYLYQHAEQVAENNLIANSAKEGIDAGNGVKLVWNEGGFIPTLKHKGDTSNAPEEEAPENSEDNEGDPQGFDNHEEESEGTHKGEGTMNEISTLNQRRRAQQNAGKLKPRKPLTLNEELRNMSPEHRALLQNALELQQEQKDRVIEIITNSERNQFTPEFLGTKDLRELEAIAALIPTGNSGLFNGDGRFNVATAPGNYLGAAGPVGNAGRGEQFDPDDLLPIPTLNFGTNEERNMPKRVKKG